MPTEVVRDVDAAAEAAVPMGVWVTKAVADTKKMVVAVATGRVAVDAAACRRLAAVVEARTHDGYMLATPAAPYTRRPA